MPARGIRGLLLVTFFLLYSFLSSQNLIINPGFEEKRGCPDHSVNAHNASLNQVRGWNNANRSSCDYFHVCELEATNRNPLYTGLYHSAHSGLGLVGMVLYLESYNQGPANYREMLITRLTDPLEAGQTYLFDCYILLSPESQLTVHGPDFYLARDPLELNHLVKNNEVLRLSLYDSRRLITGQRLTDTSNWTLIHAEYMARGGEQYMVIGNFKNNANSAAFENPNRRKNSTILPKSCYVLIDDVNLEPKENALIAENFVKGKTFILQNLYFTTSSSMLEGEHQSGLEQLLRVMLIKPDAKIRIVGHTDNVGEAAFNRRLSVNRAKSVKNYLTEAGISADRMIPMGMGSTKAIATNATEEGRARNRRVEVYVLE